MGFTMWLQQKLNPAPADPTQARIFALLPFVFTFVLAGFAAGLVLYWSVNNILSIAQQWVIQRKILAKNGILFADIPVVSSALGLRSIVGWSVRNFECSLAFGALAFGARKAVFDFQNSATVFAFVSDHILTRIPAVISNRLTMVRYSTRPHQTPSRDIGFRYERRLWSS